MPTTHVPNYPRTSTRSHGHTPKVSLVHIDTYLTYQWMETFDVTLSQRGKSPRSHYRPTERHLAQQRR